MEIGLQFIFQNTHPGLSDADMMRRETEVALLAEDVGMDFLLLPEHHFDPNYSMMPDNLQWLSYLAGKTNRIKLGTGAIILPWHDNPTRLAEKIAMLQVVLGDRFMLGFGRGLAREEYRAFGVDMNTARERFDQSAEIILDILETGIAEYDTPHFKQSRTTVTPKPLHGYRDRGFLSVAMTPDSGVAAANLGATMMSFVQLPWADHNAAVNAWRTRFKEQHPNKVPGAPVFSDFTYCHKDAKVAEKVAREYLSKYYMSVIRHYDFDGSHWGETKGYQAYQAAASAIKEIGLDAACEGFVQNQAWGTPEQIIEKWSARVAVTGELRPAMAVSYAGMPFDLVKDSLRLIGSEIVPVLQKLGGGEAQSAVA
ncbi:MAG: alkanesulfonate monooxygenase SsuD [Gammaproteobacteria bacterium]|jgi:alkanesulfonate monooxygenase SsuD/methylene tetrahydromethanopterin reductase-like flavin-dependent oxidoreductase (luciferase family)